MSQITRYTKAGCLEIQHLVTTPAPHKRLTDNAPHRKRHFPKFAPPLDQQLERTKEANFRCPRRARDENPTVRLVHPVGQRARREYLSAWRFEAWMSPGLGGAQVVLGGHIQRQQ